MADIDLIPKEYRLQRRLRRGLQWFLVGVISIACITAAVRLSLWFVTSKEHREIARLRAQEQDVARVKAGMQQYEQQKTTAEKQLKTLETLRTSTRTKLLFEALDAAYLSGIWFDNVTVQRATVAAAAAQSTLAGATSPTLPKTAPAVPHATDSAGRVAQRVELVGHAADHSRLASFMVKLGEQPAVSDMRLLDTGSRAYSTATVIDFKLSLLFATQERR
jgi:hypothetical protein